MIYRLGSFLKEKLPPPDREAVQVKEYLLRERPIYDGVKILDNLEKNITELIESRLNRFLNALTLIPSIAEEVERLRHATEVLGAELWEIMPRTKTRKTRRI